MKLAVLSNSPGPNQVQYFDELAKIPGIALTVYYCARRNVKWRGTDTYKLNHDAQFMVNLNPWAETRESLHCNPSALSLAIHRQHDLIMIQGYSYPTALAAMLACMIFRKPFVFWGEMINRNPRPITAPVKKFFVWPCFHRAQAILTMGKSGVRSFQEIGIPVERIYEVPYSCNLETYLSVQRTANHSNDRKKRILVVAQLIKRKRVDIALKAFLSLSEQYKDWDMVICGDGPCRDELEKMIRNREKCRVIFKGFVSKDQQPAIYADSDIFLLTSVQDGWGMVVTEAMASGLPVISTYAVESARVLLDDKACGILINPNSVSETIEALELLIKDKAMRTRMGECAREKSKEYDVDRVARDSAKILLGIHQHLRVC